MPAPPPKIPQVKHDIAFFYPEKGDYYIRNSRGQWIRCSETAVKKILRYEVFHTITDEKYQGGVIERFVLNIQRSKDVAWAGQIAGYKPGIHEICGQRILVTATNRPLRPAAGKWPHLGKLIGEMLGDDANYYHAWLKSGLQAFYAGPRFRPGQMMVFTGPGGCGKSLLQNVTTELLGGRSADPTRYMFDKTDFNRDMIGSEHLSIEDSAHERSLAARRAFASKIKELLVKETQSLHKKGADALLVMPFWRITLSLNDEPENLRVLPPLDESIVDKIIILKCFKATFPYAEEDLKARQAYRHALTAELPAYLRWLQQWKIPKSILGQRYGVKHYQHPDIVRQLLEMQPEMTLWSLIHELNIWEIDKGTYYDLAVNLRAKLLDKDKYHRVSRLLEHDNTCGTYLTRLAKLFPKRVRGHDAHGHSKKWEISHPDKELSL